MKKPFIILLILFLLAACQTTRNKECVGCAHDLLLWKTAIDTIALANFPGEEYVSVVHYEKFSNAWVTTGNKVNITKNFLHELTTEQRVAVAAHEIAHLKSGHYYTKLGASILTSVGFSVLNMFIPGAGYSEYVVKPALMGGFSRPQELEADKLGVQYLEKAGFSKETYLKMLKVLQKRSGGKPEEASYFSTHPTNEERIRQIREMKLPGD
ncbi:MAG: M48 family metalloprotease [Nitrospinae bacterium]|nr:M48 family metalloprotease [Nitrospinota bacterium]